MYLALFIFLLLLFIGFLAILDWRQRTDTLRRNFPVIARIKPALPWLSQWLRHNILDNNVTVNDKPFSKRDLQYVHDAAAGKSPLLSFGTEASVAAFRFFPERYAFPARADNDYPPAPLLIGKRAETPYLATQRIMVSALSFGALSEVAVESISRGARRFNTLYNVGEGGLSPAQLAGGADLILQIGTAKYVIGEDAWTLTPETVARARDTKNIKMIEIKMAQGASIGREGGHLPGSAMTPTYADARCRPVGFETIAPNRHADIDSDVTLAQRISSLRRDTGKPVGIKLALAYPGQWDPFWQFLAKEKRAGNTSGIPDFVTIDGAEGGSVAGKTAFLLHIGLPLIEALPELERSLRQYGLREDLALIASGKLSTPERAAMAFCLGADMVAIGRGIMFSLGCIQAMRCLSRTCPTGIATHNPRYTRGLVPSEKEVRVYHYLHQLYKDTNAIAHACNKSSYDQLSRSDLGLASDGFMRRLSPEMKKSSSPTY